MPDIANKAADMVRYTGHYAPVHAPKPRTLKAWKKLKSKQRSAAKLARIAETL